MYATAGGLPQRVLRMAGPQTLFAPAEGSGTETPAAEPASALSRPWAGQLYHLIRPQLSCSRKRIHRLMNEMNISSTRRRAYKATTNSRHAHPIAPNLLARRFSFDKPDTAWVGDITYIPTGEGWLYCAVVKDLCTKQIVATPSPTSSTQISLSPPSAWPSGAASLLPGLIFHSDRGVQYAAYAYRQRLAASASGKACPARAIPMTTPWPKTSSAASSASASICAISPQGTCHGRRLRLYRDLLQPSAPAFLYWLASSGCLCACLV